MVLGINNTPSVMPEDLENLIQQGYQLIDVRENDEWDAGHYKNAMHIPMGSIVAVSYTHLTLPTSDLV